MKITKTFVSSTELKIYIEANELELDSVKRHVLGHYLHSVKVSGFRAGHAPLEVIEKQINPVKLHNEFLEHAINGMYKKAVEKEDLRPIGQPKVEIKKFVPFTTLEFEVDTGVIGRVSLPDYKKLHLKPKKVEIRAADINLVLNNLKIRFAERVSADRPAKIGDELVIDFKGFDSKKVPVAGADGKDFPIVLGSRQFIPGFEDNLVGAKTDDEVKFMLIFPVDYSVAALRSKKVFFEVKVKKLNKLIKPQLDDKFATKAGPFKTLIDLKADIKKQLLSEKNMQAQRDFENQLVSEIADKSQVDIPGIMIDDQVLAMEEEEKRNLVYRGQTWQEHLKEEGLTEKQHRERHRPQAVEQVKAGLVLSEIAEKEKLTVSEDELTERIKLLKEQYQDQAMRDQLSKIDARNDIAARLLTEKTIKKLSSYAS